MALINRDKDQSEQRDVYQCLLTGTPSGVSATIMNPVIATATTFMLATISRPSQLIAAGSVAWGLSGSPVHNLWCYRFAGGFTSIQIGASMTITAFGTSGYQGYSLTAASVSFPFQTGDQVFLNTVTANTAATQVAVTLVVKALQDIKTDFGV